MTVNIHQKYDLEHDLLTTDWILKKVKESNTYSQHLYAALCNTDWCKNDSFELLKENAWHCSWRHAGKIVSKMRQEGEYTDWYCSGIRNSEMPTFQNFVGEGIVTEIIQRDLLKLGWVLINTDDF